MSKKFKALIISGIIISCLAFITNIVLSAVFPNCGANIFTAISGWVSGIATIILGLITVAQNKRYTLITTKMEIKNSIHEEQLKIAEISDYVVRYSYLKKPLNLLVTNNVTQKDLLSYSLDIDAIREQLLMVSHKIQLLKFNPNTIILLVNKTVELIKYTYTDYQTAKDHCFNDNLLSTDISKISKFISAWTKKYIELCQQAMKELVEFSQKVNEANSINKINIILQDAEQKTKNAQKDIAKQLKQEQNNE